MNTAAPDPLDKLDQLWPAASRAAWRQEYVQKGREAADAIVADVPSHLGEASNPEGWREHVAAEWGQALDKVFDRAREIISLPEAAGREALAHHLVTATSHSVEAARIILRDAGADMAALPVGGERLKRLAAIRLAASAPGGL